MSRLCRGTVRAVSTARPVNPPSQLDQAVRHRFSQAVWAGGLLLCSGQVGRAEDGSISDDPTEQFAQAFANIDAVLAAAGLTRGHVADMTSYHVDMDRHLDAFAAARERWIGAGRPAWTAVGVAALASPSALVEVKVTASADAT